MLTIRKRQINNSMRYTPTRMVMLIKQNKTKQEYRKDQVWVRIRRTWNPHPLLVGKQNAAATVENCLAASQKTKCRVIL